MPGVSRVGRKERGRIEGRGKESILVALSLLVEGGVEGFCETIGDGDDVCGLVGTALLGFVVASWLVIRVDWIDRLVVAAFIGAEAGV